MDELKEKRNILLKNKSHILRMSNNKQKVDTLKAYISLLDYYQSLLGAEVFDEEVEIDDEFMGKYGYYVFRDTSKRIDEIEKNAPKLYSKYQKIIDDYKNNDFCMYEYIKWIKVDRKQMEVALWNFFASLGDDVLKIYRNMIIGRNICLESEPMGNYVGVAMDSTPLDNPCIMVKNIPNYLDFYITLAHEVGHCYQFYLQKNQRCYAMFSPYEEITSMLFEKLFIEYLKNNYLIKNTSTIDLENQITLLGNVSVSKAMCKLLMEDKIGIINPYSLDYTCSGSDYEEAKKEIAEDCGYIQFRDMSPEFIKFHYSFGDIISTHFMEKLKDDFDTEWTNFKNFICSVNYLPMSEVIDEHFDLGLIQNNIKKLTKSYRER